MGRTSQKDTKTQKYNYSCLKSSEHLEKKQLKKQAEKDCKEMETKALVCYDQHVLNKSHVVLS